MLKKMIKMSLKLLNDITLPQIHSDNYMKGKKTLFICGSWIVTRKESVPGQVNSPALPL